MMVQEAIFIGKFTRPEEKVWKFHLSAHNLWQGCHISIIDVLLDSSTHHFYNEVPDDGSGRHFYSEIQHPA